MTSDTPDCDGTRQPWVIHAEVGQQINLTLYDFTLSNSEDVVAGPARRKKLDTVLSSSMKSCRQYGIIEDNKVERRIMLCGGQSRICRSYLSKGNVVKLWITAGIAPTDLQRFVLKYAGNVNNITSFA